MSSKLLWVLFSLGLYLSVASAEVDCSKRPERVNPKTCCPMPDIISDELKEKCKKFNNTMPRPPPSPMPMSDEKDSESNNNSEGRHPHHHHHHHHRHHFPSPCFFSCFLNESGIYVDSKLDELKLKSYLKTVFANSTELQDATAASFATCAAKSAEFRDKMKDMPMPPAQSADAPACSHDAGFLMGCVFRKTLKNCPASIWNDTESCNNMREYFENCKPRRGPPPPPSDEM